MGQTNTLDQLNQLKLTGMVQAFQEQQESIEIDSLSFDERLACLVDREVTYRKNRRLQRLQRQAKLRQQACVEEIDYQHPRGLKRDQIAKLLQTKWLEDALNLIMTGPTGIGKSWLACALGQHACRQGKTVRYVRLPRLLEELRIAHADGSYAKLMNSLAKVQLLILDDWGIDVLKREQRNDLLEVLEDRHQLNSTLITSQLPVDQWHAFIGEATIADAIVDRLIHHAHHIKLKGESMRRKKSKTTNSLNSLTEGEHLA